MDQELKLPEEMEMNSKPKESNKPVMIVVSLVTLLVIVSAYFTFSHQSKVYTEAMTSFNAHMLNKEYNEAEKDLELASNQFFVSNKSDIEMAEDILYLEKGQLRIYNEGKELMIQEKWLEAREKLKELPKGYSPDLSDLLKKVNEEYEKQLAFKEKEANTKKTETNTTVQRESSSKTSVSSSSDSGPPISGENAVLNEDIIIGVGETKSNYDEMMTYIVNKNYTAVDQMIAEGRAYPADKGTPITIVERNFSNSKVQVIGTRIRGWVPNEFISR